ncbi:hypothetical protein ACFWYW_46855 [Nonomuraea sp. NPDC059023]|uniref:hypothetical protein n=1 Tax=unclassified Nonomuraea TaxID=2593643 RepID=UPI0036BB26F5
MADVLDALLVGLALLYAAAGIASGGWAAHRIRRSPIIRHRFDRLAALLRWPTAAMWLFVIVGAVAGGPILALVAIHDRTTRPPSKNGHDRP